MTTDPIISTLKSATADANKLGQLGSFAHVLVHCLERTTRSDSEPVLAAVRTIRQRVLPFTTKDGVAPKSDRRSFEYDDAADNFSAFAKSRTDLPPATTDRVLIWLLSGDWEDDTRKNCDTICSRNGVTPAFLFPSRDTLIPTGTLGFGEIVHIAGTVPGSDLSGRDADLEKHLGFLTQCVRQRRHYLLEGHPGVGKSCFIRHLVHRALGRWEISTEDGLNKSWFLMLSPYDFVGSEEEIKARLDHLYAYLEKRPHIVPVFDGFEHLLNRSLVAYNLLAARFGAVLSGGGRTFVLVSQTIPAGTSELLKLVKGYPLPALSAEQTRPIVGRLLRETLGRDAAKWECDPDEDTFVNTLLNLARERYPGRFLPGIASHLVESSVLRAENRVLFLKQGPKNRVSVDDLWQHVSEEQGINPETFGSNPTKFYARLRSDLKSDVLCQDHAIDLVCRELEFQARRPPQRTPRGRFMFVGSPGVGKTELARSLASRLGIGDEAFLIFNMSEYSTDAARTRFMGADPGYVGFRATRTIYDQVRARPSCVVLLDEIDRADPSIQDILLSILEGQGKDAEGNPVYFSQAVFIMTTNQGQKQVRAAYEAAGEQGRAQLVNEFDDTKLRSLLLKGVLDETELAMKKSIDEQLKFIREEFPNVQSDAAKERFLIGEYLKLKDTQRQMENVQRRPPLDPALLDRIDFIIPFFPIKDPDSLQRILTQKLGRFGWPECPAKLQAKILSEALVQDESVRPLERLIKKYYALWASDIADSTPENGRAAKRARSGRK